MDIKSIAELKKVITLCQKLGVESFKVGNGSIEISLRERIGSSKISKKNAATADQIETDNQLTEMDALFWSSAGVPDLQQAG